MNAEDFYRAFEDKFRGSRDLIKSRLEVYLPFVMPLQEIYEKCDVLDIGCGRGEWLELMSENGFNATGVDLDDGMLEACKKRNLNAINKDALLALKELTDESQVVVSGFHIAEHLPFEILLEIVKEAIRVLKPAGLLILETPNSENIRVGTSYFYHDPTHIKPIPMLTLSFQTEYYGFTRNKILRLQESEQLKESKSVSLFDVYCGASQDYAVVAQKTASEDVLSVFDDIFAKDFGLSVETLCGQFEGRLSNIFLSIETTAKNAEAKAQSAETALNAIYASRSWKITAPYRALGDFTKNSKQKTKNALKPFAAKCVTFVIKHPRLKKQTVKRLQNFPKIESRLRQFYDGYYTHNKRKYSSYVNTENPDLLQLTPEAIKVYRILNQRFKKKRGPE